MTATPAPAPAELDSTTREALAELLLAMADDEFVIGFWDSEWTGIAPMLEEDVAMSSIAQDEIGHARALYELLASLTDDDADRIAFGRRPHEYRHAALMNHARTDWAFTIARRYLYDTADAVRLEALAGSAHEPLAQLATKMRREESYHLMHMEAWVRRLTGTDDSRRRLSDALERLWPDAQAVFAPLSGEACLVTARILPDSLEALRGRWLARAIPPIEERGLPVPSAEQRAERPVPDGRTRRTDDFAWLWNEFTMVHRSEEGAEW
jgi:ring-1,2-phenylacetyl-CoA epoxidase subunit PaaC